MEAAQDIPVAAFDMQGAGYSDPGIGFLAFSSYLKINSTSSACFGFKDFRVLANFCQMFLVPSVFRLVLLQQPQNLSSMQFSLNVLAIFFRVFVISLFPLFPLHLHLYDLSFCFVMSRCRL